MFARMTKKGKLGMLIAFALVICVVVCSYAEVLMPEATGKKVQKDGKLLVDSSNCSEGYIMVRTKKDNKRMKLRITMGGSSLNYDINSDGNFEVFPLQFGRVPYTVTLWRNVEGKKYKEVGKVVVQPKDMTDELRCFLYPNQYVNYTADTECVKVAGDLCKDLTEAKDIFKTVTKYVVSNFSYDFIKSVTVKSGELPDIEYCWEKKMGICQDLSAMTCAMLRSQGVPARLIIGTLGSGTPHAWVLAVVDGEDTFFDPTAELNATNKTDTYTTERWY